MGMVWWGDGTGVGVCRVGHAGWGGVRLRCLVLTARDWSSEIGMNLDWLFVMGMVPDWPRTDQATTQCVVAVMTYPEHSCFGSFV